MTRAAWAAAVALAALPAATTTASEARPRVVAFCNAASPAARVAAPASARHTASSARVAAPRHAASRCPIVRLGRGVAPLVAPPAVVARPDRPAPAAPVDAPPGGPVVVAPAPTPPPPPVVPENPRAVSVRGVDSDPAHPRLVLSRTSVLSGTVRIEFSLRTAQDPHNLVLEPAAGGAPVVFDPLAPGAVKSRSETLAPGRWVLYCALSDHRARGMEATLTVAPG
jgi:hypothetical protein